MVRWIPRLIFICGFVAALGCTRPMETASRISIRFPSSNSLTAYQSTSTPTTGSTKWTLGYPTSSSEFNCFAISISSPGEDPTVSNSCHDSAKATVFRAGVIFGGFAAGTNTQLEVPSGLQKTIRLIGFKTSNRASCTAVDLIAGGFSTTEFSAPFVLDEVIKDLAPGPVEVVLNVPSTPPIAKTFEDCAPYSFERPGSIPRLSIETIAPISGANGGGNAVTITGTGFNAATQVSIGGVTCNSPLITPRSISCTTGARAAGPADVVVTRGDSTVTLSSAYTYETLPDLLISDISVDENAGTVNLTVTLSGNATAPVTFKYATFSGTATPADFAQASAMGSISAGNTSTTIQIPIVDDMLDEDDETFTVRLTSPLNAGIADGEANVTVIDNDEPPTVQFVAAASARPESGSTGAIAIQIGLSAPSGRTVTVPYTTSGTATVGSDHDATAGTVTFAPGQINANINFNLINDTVLEGLETIVLTLGTPTHAGLGSLLVHTLTIQDDEPPTATILSGAPAPLTNASTFSVTVGGTFVKEYRYALGVGITCSNISYNAPTSMTVPISTTLSQDGVYRLCVLAISESGVPQPPASATSFTFTRDTVPPIVTLVHGIPTASGTPTSPIFTRMDVIPITVNFSEPMSETFDQSDISLMGGTNASVSAFARINDKTFKFNLIAGTTSGPLQVGITPSAAQDLAGNGNQGSALNFNYSVPPGQWNPMNNDPLKAPSNRFGAASVYTGSHWFIYGGSDGPNILNTGHLYSPLNDSWTNLSGLPHRVGASAVTNGHRVFVWGGHDGFNPLNTGFSLSTSTATPVLSTISLNGQPPSPRFDHSALWSGNRMFIWGGLGCIPSSSCTQPYLNSGASFDPNTNSWNQLQINGAPPPRARHVAVIADGLMLVWGGLGGTTSTSSFFNTGARYSIYSNSWTLMSPPPLTARADAAFVWTGSRLIIWGGQTSSGLAGDGAFYEPLTNTWSMIAQTGDIPGPRARARAVWTGTHMIIWGGFGSNGEALNDGYAFDPTKQNWIRIKTDLNQAPRVDHSMAWTGSELLLFGGSNKGTALGVAKRLTPLLHQAAQANLQPLSPVVKSVEMGDTFTCALLDGGRVRCWGDNSFGQLGYGDTRIRGQATADMGVNLPYLNFGTNKSVLQLALGHSFACVLLNDHSVKCWGHNTYGQLGTGDSTHRGDQTGEMGDNLPNVVNLPPARQIAVGMEHACAVLFNGNMSCWGRNNFGQLGSLSPNSSSTPIPISASFLGTGEVEEVAAGDNHTCTRAAQQITCWGGNAQGQLGGAPIANIAPPKFVQAFGMSNRLVARSNSTCVEDAGGTRCWGGISSRLSSPVIPLIQLNNINRFSLGSEHVCGIGMPPTGTTGAAGPIVCAGAGQYGALGRNDTGVDSTTFNPIAMQPPTGIVPVGVSSNLQSNCAWYSTGEVLCWGHNFNGRLGRGDSTPMIGTSQYPMSSIRPVDLLPPPSTSP